MLYRNGQWVPPAQPKPRKPTTGERVKAQLAEWFADLMAGIGAASTGVVTPVPGSFHNPEQQAAIERMSRGDRLSPEELAAVGMRMANTPTSVSRTAAPLVAPFAIAGNLADRATREYRRPGPARPSVAESTADALRRTFDPEEYGPPIFPSDVAGRIVGEGPLRSISPSAAKLAGHATAAGIDAGMFFAGPALAAFEPAEGARAVAAAYRVAARASTAGRSGAVESAVARAADELAASGRVNLLDFGRGVAEAVDVPRQAIQAAARSAGATSREAEGIANRFVSGLGQMARPRWRVAGQPIGQPRLPQTLSSRQGVFPEAERVFGTPAAGEMQAAFERELPAAVKQYRLRTERGGDPGFTLQPIREAAARAVLRVHPQAEQAAVQRVVETATRDYLTGVPGASRAAGSNWNAFAEVMSRPYGNPAITRTLEEMGLPNKTDFVLERYWTPVERRAQQGLARMPQHHPGMASDWQELATAARDAAALPIQQRLARMDAELESLRERLAQTEGSITPAEGTLPVEVGPGGTTTSPSPTTETLPEAPARADALRTDYRQAPTVQYDLEGNPITQERENLPERQMDFDVPVAEAPLAGQATLEERVETPVKPASPVREELLQTYGTVLSHKKDLARRMSRYLTGLREAVKQKLGTPEERAVIEARIKLIEETLVPPKEKRAGGTRIASPTKTAAYQRRLQQLRQTNSPGMPENMLRYVARTGKVLPQWRGQIQRQPFDSLEGTIWDLDNGGPLSAQAFAMDLRRLNRDPSYVPRGVGEAMWEWMQESIPGISENLQGSGTWGEEVNTEWDAAAEREVDEMAGRVSREELTALDQEYIARQMEMEEFLDAARAAGVDEARLERGREHFVEALADIEARIQEVEGSVDEEIATEKRKSVPVQVRDQDAAGIQKNLRKQIRERQVLLRAWSLVPSDDVPEEVRPLLDERMGTEGRRVTDVAGLPTPTETAVRAVEAVADQLTAEQQRQMLEHATWVAQYHRDEVEASLRRVQEADLGPEVAWGFERAHTHTNQPAASRRWKPDRIARTMRELFNPVAGLHDAEQTFLRAAISDVDHLLYQTKAAVERALVGLDGQDAAAALVTGQIVARSLKTGFAGIPDGANLPFTERQRLAATFAIGGHTHEAPLESFMDGERVVLAKLPPIIRRIWEAADALLELGEQMYEGHPSLGEGADSVHLRLTGRNLSRLDFYAPKTRLTQDHIQLLLNKMDNPGFAKLVADRLTSEHAKASTYGAAVDGVIRHAFINLGLDPPPGLVQMELPTEEERAPRLFELTKATPKEYRQLLPYLDARWQYEEYAQWMAKEKMAAYLQEYARRYYPTVEELNQRMGEGFAETELVEKSGWIIFDEALLPGVQDVVIPPEPAAVMSRLLLRTHFAPEMTEGLATVRDWMRPMQVGLLLTAKFVHAQAVEQPLRMMMMGLFPRHVPELGRAFKMTLAAVAHASIQDFGLAKPQDAAEHVRYSVAQWAENFLDVAAGGDAEKLERYTRLLREKGIFSGMGYEARTQGAGVASRAARWTITEGGVAWSSLIGWVRGEDVSEVTQEAARVRLEQLGFVAKDAQALGGLLTSLFFFWDDLAAATVFLTELEMGADENTAMKRVGDWFVRFGRAYACDADALMAQWMLYYKYRRQFWGMLLRSIRRRPIMAVIVARLKKYQNEVQGDDPDVAYLRRVGQKDFMDTAFEWFWVKPSMLSLLTPELYRALPGRKSIYAQIHGPVTVGVRTRTTWLEGAGEIATLFTRPWDTALGMLNPAITAVKNLSMSDAESMVERAPLVSFYSRRARYLGPGTQTQGNLLLQNFPHLSAEQVVAKGLTPEKARAPRWLRSGMGKPWFYHGPTGEAAAAQYEVEATRLYMAAERDLSAFGVSYQIDAARDMLRRMTPAELSRYEQLVRERKTPGMFTLEEISQHRIRKERAASLKEDNGRSGRPSARPVIPAG